MDATQRDIILKSESGNRMIDTVSPIYEESYVGCWMYEIMGREYDKLWDIIKSLPSQLFPESVTWAIELWDVDMASFLRLRTRSNSAARRCSKCERCRTRSRPMRSNATSRS